MGCNRKHAMSEAWSALIKPRLVVVSPEPSNQEAA